MHRPRRQPMVVAVGPNTLGAFAFVSGASLISHTGRVLEWLQGAAESAPGARDATCPDCLCTCGPVFLPSAGPPSVVSVESGGSSRFLSLCAALLASHLLVAVLTALILRRFYLRMFDSSPTLGRPALSPRTFSESSITSAKGSISDSPERRVAGVATPKSRR